MLRHFLATFATLLCFATAAHAESVSYTVRDVEVSATAADGTTARMNAMTQAEREAFARLLEQLLLPEEAPVRAAAAQEYEISRMVRGYEVHNEKVGSTSYAATLDVNFDQNQVQAWLNRGAAPAAGMPAAMPAAAVPAPAPVAQRPAASRSNVLVLPVLATDSTTMLWEEQNVWRNAWNAAERSDTRFIRLPIGDQSDKLMMEAAQVTTAPYASFSAIAERYQSSTIVVAEAFPTIGSGVRALGVRLRSLGMGGQTNTLELTYEQGEGETEAALMQRAASDIIDRIMREGASNSSPEQLQANAPRSKLTVLSRLNKLNDWVVLRKRLLSLPSVEQVELSAISSQQADMVVHFRGSPDQLEAAMASQGLKVSKAYNYWVLGY